MFFFLEDLRYIPDSGLSLGFPSVSVSVHNNGRSNTSAAAVELAELRKITTFSGKNTIFDEHKAALMLIINILFN